MDAAMGTGPTPSQAPGPHGDSAEVAGATQVSAAAVERLAASAARGVHGVNSLGSGAGRAFGALRGRVSGNHSESAVGVSAEVGQEEVAVDLTLIAEYGRPLHDIAADVRAAVYTAVGDITGLRVIEVNVEIGDLHIPAPASAGSASTAVAETAPADTAPAGTTTEPPTHRPLEGDHA